MSLNTTITHPGYAEKIITVAAYVTKRSWSSLDGIATMSSSYALSEIAPFSSWGPPRTEQFLKPEIAAPGCAIVSALSLDSSYSARYVVVEAPAYQHVVKFGTSLAAPT